VDSRYHHHALEDFAAELLNILSDYAGEDLRQMRG
jgi:hypothetical protein